MDTTTLSKDFKQMNLINTQEKYLCSTNTELDRLIKRTCILGYCEHEYEGTGKEHGYALKCKKCDYTTTLQHPPTSTHGRSPSNDINFAYICASATVLHGQHVVVQLTIEIVGDQVKHSCIIADANGKQGNAIEKYPCIAICKAILMFHDIQAELKFLNEE